jgi:hypothetical protein
MFWEEPKEGLYEINVGLNSTDEQGSGHIMAFSDLNSDKYTDIITVNEAGNNGLASFNIHFFDINKQTFQPKLVFTPTDCSNIRNVAVGRSS